MSRGGLAVMVCAIVAGAAAAVAIVVLGTGGEAESDLAADQQRFPPTSERAPEAENPSPMGLDAAERAARDFLDGYLPLIYAQPDARLEDVQRITPEFAADLRANPPRVPPAQAALKPDVESVTVAEDGPSRALAVAQIKDEPGSPAYPLIFEMADTPQGWLVTRLGGN